MKVIYCVCKRPGAEQGKLIGLQVDYSSGFEFKSGKIKKSSDHQTRTLVLAADEKIVGFRGVINPKFPFNPFDI